MAVFKGAASPTATSGTTECRSRITCTPPPPPRPGEASPRVPRALCPLCRRQQHTAKGTGSPTNQNLAVQKRGGGLLGRAIAQGSLRERSHPEGRNSSRRARPGLPSLCRTNLASPWSSPHRPAKTPLPQLPCQGMAGGWKRRAGVGGGVPSHYRRTQIRPDCSTSDAPPATCQLHS